jgi:hypothetical protein
MELLKSVFSVVSIVAQFFADALGTSPVSFVATSICIALKINPAIFESGGVLGISLLSSERLFAIGTFNDFYKVRVIGVERGVAAGTVYNDG